MNLAFATIAGLVAVVLWLVARDRRMTAELAATRTRFQGYMDHGPFLAFMKDDGGRYVYENRLLSEHIGRIRPGTTTCIGRTDDELFPARERQAYVDNDRRVLDTGLPMQFDEVSVDADGTVRHWSTVKFSGLHDTGQRFLAGISIDVTEAHRARADARSQEDRCGLALEAGRMGTLTLDLKTQMLDTSTLFAILHGRPATKTRLSLMESLADVHPDDRQAIIAAVDAALRDMAPNRITYRVQMPEGGLAWIELVGQVYADDTGQPAVVRGVAFDVTDKQQVLQELGRRKAVLRRLITVQEHERQMLCHEIHDGMMQYAIGAAMLLENAQEPGASAAPNQHTVAALDCLRRGIAEGRQVIRGVRSAVLDDLGLTAGIHDLVDQMAAFGIAVETRLSDDLDTIPPELQITVYRVAQESLTNVRKHADTDRAVVEIQRNPTEVRIRVSDAGRGFDVTATKGQGFGLDGMAERVRLAGGTFELEARPGGGSCIRVRLPIADPEAPEVPAAAIAARDASSVLA